MTIKQRAKRILKSFNFAKDTHCISLVGEKVNHAANGYEAIILKATNPKEETIEVSKALEQVSLTISMEQFLRKFFHMWDSDAEVLTKLLGFETEHEAYMKERESQSDDYDWAEEHEKWINDRVSQFSIMKSMNEGKVTEITKSQFEQIVALQQKHEAALIELEKSKEKEMNELEITKAALVEKEAEVATQVELVKSLNSQVAELQQQIDVMKAAEEEAKLAAFTEQLKDVVEEDKLVSVAKGLYQLHKVDAESAATTIEAMKSAKQAKDAALQVAADGLTTEQGHSEQVDEQLLQVQKNAAAINEKLKAFQKR